MYCFHQKDLLHARQNNVVARPCRFGRGQAGRDDQITRNDQPVIFQMYNYTEYSDLKVIFDCYIISSPHNYEAY